MLIVKWRVIGRLWILVGFVDLKIVVKGDVFDIGIVW